MNSMQLKAVVRNMAKEKRVSAQLVLQNYMLERFWSACLFPNIEGTSSSRVAS